MGVAETVTIILVTLKLLGVITWSWLYVLLPEIIALIIYLIVIIYSMIQTYKFNKLVKKIMEKE